MSFRTTRHGGAKKVLSLVSVSDDAAIIRAVKKEEKGDRIIVRVQNTVGHALKDVKLTFAANLTSVTETNGYEDKIAPVAFDGNTLTLDFGKYGVRTFAVELEKPAETVAPAEYMPIGLPMDKRITSYQFRLDMGEFAQGISIPGELWEEQIVSSGVPFWQLREEMKNAMTCRGQTIKIPAGATSVSVLAASANGDKTVTFRAFSRMVSLGSVMAALTMPLFLYEWYNIMGGDGALTGIRFPIAVLMTVCVIAAHIPNIKRIYAGTEPKITFPWEKKKGEKKDKKEKNRKD